MTSKKKEQMKQNETIVEDAALEALLEERQELKTAVSQYRQKDKDVKAKIKLIESPTPYRVGRFVIDKQTTKARHVKFDADEGIRFTIKRDGEE